MRLSLQTPGGCRAQQDFDLELASSASPVSLGNSLRLVKPVHLEWIDVGASSHDVYRAPDKLSIPGAVIDSTAATAYDDATAPALAYYHIVGQCP